MQSIGNILLEKEILLESGTNEVEVLEFRLGSYRFGINVAKVREILPYQKLTELPNSHPSVVGCFNLRDKVVPCVSLHRHLKEEQSSAIEFTKIILTEFNQHQTAFVVDDVYRIHRISWEKILAAPRMVTNVNSPVTAVTILNGNMITMLDFEMIGDQVANQVVSQNVIANPNEVPRDELRILLADDSISVRQAVEQTLHRNGYTNIKYFENGARVWEWIAQEFDRTKDASKVCVMLVSDVEMPEMDGFHLTKRIKEHPQLQKIPVLLYSSILTPENLKKGKSVKADAQITKPELEMVVKMADNLLQSGSMLCPNSEVETTPEVKEANTDAPIETQLEIPPTTPVAPTPEPTIAKSTAPESSQTESLTNTLWPTFVVELSDKAKQLQTVCASANETLGAPEANTSETVNQVFRLLHSIKSASMVIPVDEVTETTHLIENLLELAREDLSNWPGKELSLYNDWVTRLGEVRDPKETQSVLSEATTICQQIR